jgi:4-aminobutyrate aminotransferase-like enzyme
MTLERKSVPPRCETASGLAADVLAADPRVIEAHRLLLEAIGDHQRTLTGVRAPAGDRADDYDRLIQHFGQLRGGELYFPYLGSGIGNGALVELADGSVKYDMISGIGVHYFGHGHPAILAATIRAAMSDIVMQGNLQQDREAVDLTRLLLEQAGTGGCKIAHALLTTSGAMANENALKIVFQKKQPAQRLLAFEHGFAGRTLALAQVTDKAAYRVGLPTVLAVDYVPFFNPAAPHASTAATLAALKRHLARFPKQYAAMIVECVQGEGGYHAGDAAFFAALCRELRANNIAIVFDEVQTFGRTTRLFAFQHFGLEEFADVVTIGKLSQLCATLFTPEFKPLPGLISQTFTASTSALFAGRAIIRELLAGDYFGPAGRIQCVHDWFEQRLLAIAARHPGWIAGPFGLGAMIAFTPFDGSADAVKNLLRKLFENGVIAFLAGADPIRVRFLPPVGAVSEQDVESVCRILETTMQAMA